MGKYQYRLVLTALNTDLSELLLGSRTSEPWARGSAECCDFVMIRDKLFLRANIGFDPVYSDMI